MRGIALLSGALLLSGCMTAKVGTDYAAISQKIGPPKPGLSRVVVLQQKRDGLSMALCACDVKLEAVEPSRTDERPNRLPAKFFLPPKPEETM